MLRSKLPYADLQDTRASAIPMVAKNLRRGWADVTVIRFHFLPSVSLHESSFRRLNLELCRSFILGSVLKVNDIQIY